MKKVLLIAVLAVGSLCSAAPARHPAYEPDGQPVRGRVARARENLFLNAAVSATGQWDSCAPAFAVDGKADAKAGHWAAENLPQALTVDMGAVKTLAEVRLVPYWTDGRFYGFKVEGSADGKTWRLLADRATNKVCAGATGFTLPFDPVGVRYVRTTFVSNSRGRVNGAHIVEIEGYARARDTSVALLAGDLYTRYDRDIAVDRTLLRPIAKLRGWRGERVSAQLVASSSGGFAELRLAAADPRARLDVLRYTRGNGKLYGDILDGTTETRFKGVTRPVIYTYDIPSDAAGTIRDTVTATINGTACRLPVEIAVVPRTLPPAKEWAFHLDFWQHPDPIARWHDVPVWSDRHFALLADYYRLLAEMGQKTVTATLIDEAWNAQTYDRFRANVQVTKRVDGTWAYDYSVFDRIVETAAAAGLDGQIDCYSMLPWSLAFRYFDEKENRSVCPRMEPGSAEYADFWGHLLADFCRHLKAKGWFARARIALDERPDRLIQPALKILRASAPGLQMVMACNTPSRLTAEMADVAYAYDHCDGLAAAAAERRRKGWFTTYYICCGPARPNTFLFSDPAESAWLAPYAAARGFDGLLRWAWCSWVENPLACQDYTAWPSGDTSLVYPGPRLSLRALLVRDGIEAYEKTRLLGGEIPELRAFTTKRGRERGVHATDVRALDAALNR